jgi:hypothetical protein
MYVYRSAELPVVTSLIFSLFCEATTLRFGYFHTSQAVTCLVVSVRRQPQPTISVEFCPEDGGIMFL